MNMLKFLILGIGIFVLGLASYKPFNKGLSWISNKSRLIKTYWLFSLVFSLLAIIAYIVVLKYSPPDKVDIYTGVVSNSLTLIFAIFVGYFAFSAVTESRLDKFVEQANDYIAAKDYQRAIQQYEEAQKINSKQPSVLMNLLEAYLITKNVLKFDDIYPLLDKIALDGKEKLISFYLQAVRYLLTQNMEQAKEKLGNCIQYINSNPDSLARLAWNFTDIKNGYYKQLEKDADSKIIMDNFIKYLSKGLSPEEKTMFENGNFKLTKPQEVVTKETPTV